MIEKNRKTAVVLGGTVPHRELIKELRSRGYYTVLVDYFDDPPAAGSADLHCKESAMDLEAVTQIAEKYHAQLVLSSCLDQQMNIAMKVSEKLGLKHPFSSEIVEKVTNKRLMKKIMMDNKIPTAKYYVVDEDTKLDELVLSSDIIVKPIDSCGSAGVSRLDRKNREEVMEAVRKACSFGMSKKAIIEDFIEGTEMSVHGFVNDGLAHILFGTCKVSDISGGLTRQLCNMYLPKVKDSLDKRLNEIMNQIVKAFELPENTPLFMQVIIRDDDAYVIEFSPRIAGGFSSQIAKDYAGFDFLSYSIDSYLGECKKTEVGRLDRYVCNFPLYASEGVYKEVSGIDELLSKGIVSQVTLLKESGEHISNDKPSSANVVKFMIEGKTYRDCFDKISEADQTADILDINGSSMRLGRSELTWELFMDKLGKLL